MSNILVFVQHVDGKIPKVAKVAITAAVELKSKWKAGKLVGCCVGPSSKNAATEAATLGIEEVYFCEATEVKNYLSVPYSEVLIEAAKLCDASTIVAAATTTGKDLMPRLAAGLDAAQASDIVAVNEDGSIKRPMFAGDVLADVELTTPKRIITVRGTAFAPAVASGSTGAVTELKPTFSGSVFSEFVAYETSKSERPELSDAEIVVSGGRALKSSETFMEMIAPLADVLGAAIGASRAAVDSGYAPNDWQVGQTGKVVAPSLYVAVGISGAIQHLAGMKDSKVIVAINKDPEAPIFEIADYGLVADLFDVVPKLVEEIKKAKAA